MMSLACVKTFRPLLSKASSRPGPAPSRRASRRGVEVLEGRQLLSTFGSTNRHEPGPGPLGPAIVVPARREAIAQAGGSASVTYYNTDSVRVPVTVWQGLRGAAAKGRYLISGTSLTHGLLFVGTIAGKGRSHFVDVPGASLTSVYGPNELNGQNIQLVGSYRSGHPLTDPVTVHGFLFQGTTADLPSGGSYRTIDYPGATYNYVHSTMGGLAVGNDDGPTGTGPLGPGKDYIYDIATGQFVTNIVYPGSTSDTAYGIWHNGGSSYTICGGYSDVSTNNMADQDQPIGQGYIVDYNSATGQFSHWTSYSYPDGSAGSTFVTHFEGISEVKKGVYTLNADSGQGGSSDNTGFASFVTVKRNPDGTFGPASWVNLSYPGSMDELSSNSVYGNKVVGIAKGSGGFAFQAAVY
jgi:hypothetical protein